MFFPNPTPQNRGRSAAGLGETDRELLERYVDDADEAAFELLVKRYGAMVLSVCRRVLGNVQDAEDAFQATFLVLVRRARSIARPNLLGNWLYGVALRTARKARARRTRRAEQQPPTPTRSSPDPHKEAALRELQAELDEEVQRLPANFRAPLLLCYLEGLSNREAAQRLGWPMGSIAHRLGRGRELLRSRLQHRHPNVSAFFLGALPLFAAVSADSLATLQSLIMKLGRDVAGDQSALSGLSPAVKQLTEQTLQELAGQKRKSLALIVIGVLVALSAIAAAGLSGIFDSSAGSQPPPTWSCH
jgi:RNA polymerase sigma factor (sigma-70 family)